MHLVVLEKIKEAGKMKVRVITALFCCAASVGFVACGGGDDEASSSSTSSETSGVSGASGVSGSGDSFVADVNAACEAEDRAVLKYVRRNPPAPGSEETFAAGVIPIEEEFMATLEAITPPADVEDEYQAFIDNQQAQLDELREDPVAAVGSSSSGDSFLPEANALATELGFDSCVAPTGAAAE